LTSAVEAAVRALARVVDYALWLRSPVGEEPELRPIDLHGAKNLVHKALDDAERVELDQERLTELLAAYDIELWPHHPVADLAEAEARGAELGWDVVLKCTRESIRERPDQAHVWRNIKSANEMREAWQSLGLLVPDGTEAEFVVQKSAPTGVPVSIRSFEDPLFGPVVSFGVSGPVVDLLGDRSYRIPPLSRADVVSMVREVKSAPLLFGYRGAEEVDVPAIESLIAQVAEMQDDLPQISSLDLSLVLVGTGGLRVLTASATLARVTDPRPDSYVRRMPDVTSTLPQ
jgi:acyl-CoA synthetase (NDP forming)